MCLCAFARNGKYIRLVWRPKAPAHRKVVSRTKHVDCPLHTSCVRSENSFVTTSTAQKAFDNVLKAKDSRPAEVTSPLIGIEAVGNSLTRHIYSVYITEAIHYINSSLLFTLSCYDSPPSLLSKCLAECQQLYLTISSKYACAFIHQIPLKWGVNNILR